MPRPTIAEINLNAISHNIKAVKHKVGTKCKILAAVKADAYGHGAIEVSKTLLENGVDILGVAIVEEAIELRENGITAPILILGCILPSQIDALIEYSVMPTVCDEHFASELSSRVAECSFKSKQKIHINIDTGMGRIGVYHRDAVDFVKRVVALGNLEIEGIFTHFPTSDETDLSFSYKQIEIFRQITEELKREGIPISIKHIANSGAILQIPESYFDMVRPGVILYGLYPSPEVKRTISLMPALTFKTKITFLKGVSAGQTLSYGRTFTVERPMRVATLPVGYGDGLPRSLSNRGQAIVRGKRVPIVGRICMDQCLIDVTNVDGATIGDEVVLYGKQGDEAISIEEVSLLLDTIPYELVCAISKRVPRVYVK